MPYIIEKICVGCRIASGSSSDRALVNGNNLVKMLVARYIVTFHLGAVCVVELPRKIRPQNFVYKTAFAAARNTRHYCHKPYGEGNVNILEVVFVGIDNGKHFFGVGLSPL